MRTLLFLFLTGCGVTVVPTMPDAGADSGPADAGSHCTSTSCAPTEFCKTDRVCGATTSSCQPQPASCPTLARMWCGANNTVYPGECNAYLHGTDLSATADCSFGTPTVRCGWLFCDTDEYCVETPDATSPTCKSYSCEPLPAACKGSSSCTCFPQTTPCASGCIFDPSGFQHRPDGPGFKLMCGS
jgi:hypothetical protein